MRLTDLDPRWVGAGGEGVYQLTGRPCPVCPPGQIDPDCRTCLGRGQEYEPAPARHGVGISFLCPCEECTAKRTGDRDHDFHLRVFVGFANPLDGGPPHDPREGARWTRTGETFETLKLSPSIQRHRVGDAGCTWHGFVGLREPGEVTTC